MLTENAIKVLNDRYLFKDENNRIVETPTQLWRRIADTISDSTELADKIFDLMNVQKFLPNSPAFNAGTSIKSYSACYALPLHDSMESIFQTLKNAALIFQNGGGVGFDFTKIRPNGSPVKSTQGIASGAVSFASVYNAAIETIKQGGKRRGAAIGLLDVSHPEIIDWINAKDKDSKLSNFNLSVIITDKFMEALSNNKKWELVFNDKVYKVIQAKDLFDLICQRAHYCADPGIVFMDNINRYNCHKHIGLIHNTNPCVTSDTWITTSEGAKQVKKLVNEKFIAVINGQIKSPLFGTLYSSNGFFSTGIKDIYKIKTFEGFEIRLTKEHLVMILEDKIRSTTKYKLKTNWKTVSELKIGDEILLNNHRELNEWKGKYYEREGYLIGMLIGDGFISNKGTAHLAIWGKSIGVENIKNIIQKYAMEFPHQNNFKGWIHSKRDNETDINIHYVMKCNFLNNICTDLKLKCGNIVNKEITPEIEETSSEFYKGFIKGFFDSDGTVLVNHEKGSSIRLSQSNLNSMKAVQRMLLRLGIYSIIYNDRKKALTSSMPDGKGGYKDYNIKTQYELVISNDDIKIYHDKIGFNDTNKMNKVKQILDNYKRSTNERIFTAKITEILLDGIEEVYDANVEDIHQFDGNGMILHNCGEINCFVGLSPFDFPELNIKKGDELAESCNLGSFDISKYVEGLIFNYDLLALDIITAIRFLDCIPDKNEYVVPAIEKGTKLLRKIGLGIMGFADTLALLNISYNSQEALFFAANLMEFINYHSIKASIELAKMKGSFPAFKGSAWDTGEVWTFKNITSKYDWNSIKSDIKKYGIRNCNVNAIAPTGTLAIIAGCSNAIEPIFNVVYKKNIAMGTLYEVNQHFKKLMKEQNLWSSELEFKCSTQASIQHIEEIPDDIKILFLTAHDIPFEQHIKMQEIFQKFVDINISKTINLHENATVQNVKDAFMMASERCKGITIYRNNSKTTQVFTTSETSLSLLPPPTPRIRYQDHLGVVREIKTACGVFYNIITVDQYGIFEDFQNNSKKGGCDASQKALGRATSMLLRHNVPVSTIIKQFHRVDCNACIIKKTRYNINVNTGIEVTSDDLIKILSCADGVSQHLNDYYTNKEILDKMINLQNIIHLKFNKNLVEDNLSKDSQLSNEQKRCTNCGSTNVSNDKCSTCLDCHYSKCL